MLHDADLHDADGLPVTSVALTVLDAADGVGARVVDNALPTSSSTQRR
ncbi:hypothetical protein ACPXB3_14230 [Gordonia sp. DT219]